MGEQYRGQLFFLNSRPYARVTGHSLLFSRPDVQLVLGIRADVDDYGSLNRKSAKRLEILFMGTP